MSHVSSRAGSPPMSVATSGGTSAAPLRSPWRWLASFLLLVAGAAHVPLISEHLEEAPYIGVLFMLLAIICAVLAVLVVVADATLVWVASAVVTALALAGFLLSRTVGLPQIGDDIGNWTEPLGFPAVGAEALMVVLALLVVGPHHTRKGHRS